jgi:hypothetical protein
MISVTREQPKLLAEGLGDEGEWLTAIPGWLPGWLKNPLFLKGLVKKTFPGDFF